MLISRAVNASPNVEKTTFVWKDGEGVLYEFDSAIEVFHLLITPCKVVETVGGVRDDKNEHAHKWLGLTLFFNLDDREAGIMHLRRALELDPDIVDAARIRQTIDSFPASR